jgi:hypothetical protein
LDTSWTFLFYIYIFFLAAPSKRQEIKARLEKIINKKENELADFSRSSPHMREITPPITGTVNDISFFSYSFLYWLAMKGKREK